MTDGHSLFPNIFMSDVVQCDGYSLDEFVVLDASEELVLHTFPYEEPTVSGLRLWQEAICLLCGGTTYLPYWLGRFLSQPHRPCEWFTSDTTSTLFWVRHSFLTVVYNVYTRHKGHRTTRHGAWYTWSQRIEVDIFVLLPFCQRWNPLATLACEQISTLTETANGFVQGYSPIPW